jgi:hypothetical protein
VDFVVGHPRSGTQLVKHLLNASGRDVSRHEFLSELSVRCVSIPTQYYSGECDDARVLHLLEHYDFHYWPQVRIDCNWKLTWILPIVRQRYPEARILHLVRDPRQNVRSCQELDYYGSSVERLPAGHDWPSRASVGARKLWYSWMPNVRRSDWSSLSQLERNCAFWTESHRLCLEESERGGRYLRLRLEDLFQKASLVRLFDFFELPLPEGQLIEQIRRTRFNHKDDEKREFSSLRVAPLLWSASELAVLERLCGVMARRLGYDQPPPVKAALEE